MDTYSHPTFYNGCNYLPILGSQLMHVSKSDLSCFSKWRLIKTNVLMAHLSLVIGVSLGWFRLTLCKYLMGEVGVIWLTFNGVTTHGHTMLKVLSLIYIYYFWISTFFNKQQFQKSFHKMLTNSWPTFCKIEFFFFISIIKPGNNLVHVTTARLLWVFQHYNIMCQVMFVQKQHIPFKFGIMHW